MVVAIPSFQVVVFVITDCFSKFSAWIQIAGVLAGSEELCAHISNDWGLDKAPDVVCWL